MSSTQPRRPAGVPTGGQFAAKTQPAPDYTIDDAEVDGPAPAHAYRRDFGIDGIHSGEPR